MTSVPPPAAPASRTAPVTASVNGTTREVGGPPGGSALDWLRGLGLTGAKNGCADGGCGACTVLVARPAVPPTTTAWTTVAPCLVPAAALAGQEVVTAEGLGTPSDPHPVQRALADQGAACARCAPAFACLLAAEYYRADRSERAEQAEQADQADQTDPVEVAPLDLRCRCGPRGPVDLPVGPADDDHLALRRSEAPPAPARLRTRDLVRPGSLTEALRVLAAEPDVEVLAGGTGSARPAPLEPPRRLAVDGLDELRGLRVDGGGVEIGAGLRLSEVASLVGPSVPLLAEALAGFGTSAVRDTATVGGHLGAARPDADLATALLALEAEVVLVGLVGGRPAERTVALSGFHPEPGGSVRRPDELIAAVRVPGPVASLGTVARVGARPGGGAKCVAVALDLFGPGVPAVTRVSVAVGGGPAGRSRPTRARATEAALMGATWTAETVAAATDVLAAELGSPDDDSVTAAHRRALLDPVLPSLHRPAMPWDSPTADPDGVWT